MGLLWKLTAYNWAREELMIMAPSAYFIFRHYISTQFTKDRFLRLDTIFFDMFVLTLFISFCVNTFLHSSSRDDFHDLTHDNSIHIYETIFRHIVLQRQIFTISHTTPFLSTLFSRYTYQWQYISTQFAKDRSSLFDTWQHLYRLIKIHITLKVSKRILSK